MFLDREDAAYQLAAALKGRDLHDPLVLAIPRGGVVIGAVLALEAARLLPSKITKLALYEPPFIIDDSRPPAPRDYAKRLTELVSSGRRGEAVEYFMKEVVLLPR